MQSMTHRSPRGFTLIELMIAVVVVGILAAVAYPSMMSFIAQGRRADAIAVLTTVVQAQERYRSNKIAYAKTFDANGLDMEAGLAQISKYYNVTMEGLGTPAYSVGYIVAATPKTGSPQNKDKDCQILKVKLDGSMFSYLSFDLAGNETTSTKKCWKR